MEDRSKREYVGFTARSNTDSHGHFLAGKSKKAKKRQRAKQHAARKVKNSAVGGRVGALHHDTVGIHSTTGHGSTPPPEIYVNCMLFFRSRQEGRRTFAFIHKNSSASLRQVCDIRGGITPAAG